MNSEFVAVIGDHGLTSSLQVKKYAGVRHPRWRVQNMPKPTIIATEKPGRRKPRSPGYALVE